MNKCINCNLCNIILPNDELGIERMKRHSYFHKMAQIQKRNTTCGNPKYVIK